MREPRKVKKPDVSLADFARAQARAVDVDRACAKRCADCPGPGVPGGCETRPKPGMIAGRADWPVCPAGLLREPTWRRIAGLYMASLVAPLERWPRGWKAYVVDGLVQLRAAVREEEVRQLAPSASGSDLPAYASTRAARVEG